MPNNLKQYRHDLMKLAKLGEEMLVDLSLRQPAAGYKQPPPASGIFGSFERNYQRWFTEAAAVVEQLIPGRAEEFTKLYSGGKHQGSKPAECTIQDWLLGRNAYCRSTQDHQQDDRSIDVLLGVTLRLKAQVEILRSAESRLESSLFDLRRLLRAEMFDSELDACRELAAHGFFRASGTIAGVVLERHLRQTAANHGLTLRRTEPTINDYNERLKKAGLLDLPEWRRIQRLADLRNLCVHDKGREPTGEEVSELIEGVSKIIKTLF